MRVLLSVSDKTGLIDLARGLSDRGAELVSTGGTARVLADAGLAPTSVSEVTGFPEMMDGRVKTLHPGVHAGILARRSRPDDLAAIGRLGIDPIDVVVVNLYPFARAAAAPETTFDELIEQIDIGGPTLVRAAAKSFADVLTVVDPSDYAAVLEELDREGGPAPGFRFALARKAFAHTAEYDTTIAAALEAVDTGGGAFSRSPLALDTLAPDRLIVSAPKLRDLRYGENPHQAAALYASGEAEAWGFGGARLLQGKALSFTNLLDLDAAARLTLEFDEPAAVVVKHTNPCGVATGERLRDAYVRARDVDPLSAFGGIVGLNRPLDADTAEAIASTFVECVVAPDAGDDACAVLAAKKNLRLVTGAFATEGAAGARDRDVRSILGGWLVQARDRVVEASEAWDAEAEADPARNLRVVTRRAPSRAEWTALRFAWRVCAHVKSNTVIFAHADRAAAVGAGQMSRVDAVKVATMKAGGSLTGTVAASDAFFPFRDGLDAVAEAGATAVVQPGGSKRDDEVIAAADEHGLAMVFAGRRHFRH
ncbi:MAG: bifunctional phosphoribosylaminoimidazolecarboxamide formyltransferase/IMP cyclohydrolase [Acidobacteria bacterium]|nr:bifunctional phosphoribosylaminoimidazolecarboxamide formyltransferase/IMP cyclohydrolase [Acidobacteriota bacterium]